MSVTARNPGGSDFAELDQYLAHCVKAILRSQDLPSWPDELGLRESGITDAEAVRRISFHGISLLLIERSGELASWPEGIAGEVLEEARQQTFWEPSHRRAISQLLEALHQQRIAAFVTKGTALAYSVYDDPAVRRRGDSDVVVESASRNAVRSVLRQCGFAPGDDARSLQESWQTSAPPNFVHQVDVHWRINASAAISQQLEAIGPADRVMELRRLSPNARGLAPVDNLILICINRTAHNALGYTIGSEKLFEGDRLIWAVDLDLITRAFDPQDWDCLIERAIISGTSGVIASGLAFAWRICASPIPPKVMVRLSHSAHEDDLVELLAPNSSRSRLWLDLAASPTLTEKARLMRYTLFPAPQFLRERFPNAANWPPAALGARRIISGLGKMLRNGT